MLGSGGMANVYVAVSHGPGGFDKLVVLKTLRTDAAFDPDLRRMFLGEARISARLAHPNVIHTYEVAMDDDGSPVLVMEYLEGAPLNLLMDRARGGDALSLRVRLSIVCDALEGLHYAHELGDFDGSPLHVVHRDVSPHNIHVGVDGIVKVLDFGIARAKGLTSQTRTGVVKGKVRYMGPEQIRGDKVDRRADIYAVGAVLWELATGTRLWRGTPDIETMHKVVTVGVPRASTVNKDVSPALDDIIARALSREAAARHPDCLELQADLERVLEGIGGRAHPREIGRVVTALFADVHAERSRAIEELLAEREAPMSDRPTIITAQHKVTLPPLGMTGSRSALRLADLTGSSGSNSRVGFSTDHPIEPPPPAAPSWRRRAAYAAAPLLLLVAVGVRAFVAAPSRAAAVPPAPSAALPAPAPSVSAAPRPAEVRLVVHTTPSDAVVSLDGVAVTGEPAAGSYAPDPTPRTVRVERGGYVAWSSRVLLDRDVELRVTLDPAPAAPAAIVPGPLPKKRVGPAGSAGARKPSRPLDTGVPW